VRQRRLYVKYSSSDVARLTRSLSPCAPPPSRTRSTGELGRLASQQVDIIHQRRRAALKDPLAVLERPGRRVKGLRGEVDIDELTELVRAVGRGWGRGAVGRGGAGGGALAGQRRL
jgi:hypothetical protein